LSTTALVCAAFVCLRQQQLGLSDFWKRFFKEGKKNQNFNFAHRKHTPNRTNEAKYRPGRSSIRHVPWPQPSLGPLTGVRVRRNSSSVVDGSTPATSYLCPFTAATTAAARVQIDYNVVHLQTSLVQLFVLLLQVQIIELRRFGGAPNGYPFAVLAAALPTMAPSPPPLPADLQYTALAQHGSVPWLRPPYLHLALVYLCTGASQGASNRWSWGTRWRGRRRRGCESVTLAAVQAAPVGQGVKGARPMPWRPPNVKGFEFGSPVSQRVRVGLAKHACIRSAYVHFFFVWSYKLTSQRRWSWQVDARHVGRKPVRATGMLRIFLIF
jgi:hypothetical protein